MLGGSCEHGDKAKRTCRRGPFVAIIEAPKATGADSAKDLIRVSISPYENRSFQIGASMKHEDWVNLLLLLVQNLDVFA